MPEGDAQKKEIDQADQRTETSTGADDANRGAGQLADGGASTDAQKKEIQEV
jgi:hypothetical protein